MMATATATTSRMPITRSGTSAIRAAMSATSSAKAGTVSSASPSAYDFPHPAVAVERDEEWVRQLEEEQRQRFDTEVRSMYKQFLQDLHDAGPYVTTETRADLQRRYDEGLEQMRQMQQEELEQHIEMERQQRLWSLGLQDENWEGWDGVYQEQSSILAKIRRDAAQSGGIDSQGRNMQEQIRENEREVEELLRKSEDWQRTDHIRQQDRQRWSERQRQMNNDIEGFRQRDKQAADLRMAKEKAREMQSTRLEEEARYNAAQLRSRASGAALNPEFEASRRSALPPLSGTSSRTSVTDSIFSTSPSVETSASSVFGGFAGEPQRWNPTDTAQPRPSAARPIPIPVPIPDDIRRTSSAHISGTSPSRSRPPGMQSTPSPSPLSGTPTSNTMAWAKGDELPRPKVWIPPETAREPTRKGSMFFEGTKEPARKGSQLFGASPGPSPSPTLDEPSRRTANEQVPRPQPAPSPQPPMQPPNAPTTRSQPLPPQFGPATASQARASAAAQPAAAQPYSTPPPPTTAHTSQSPPSAAYFSAFNDTKRRQEEPTRGTTAPRPAPAPTPMNTGAKPAPSPMRANPNPSAKPNTPPKPTPSPASGAGDYRSKLRDEYVRTETQRVEEEKRRREEEMNERRAEEARRRGMENRRKEEQAREAERREADRKARLTGKAPPTPTGPERPVLEVWNAYESQWAAMGTASQLRFRSIPWPVLMPVTEPEMLLPIKIAAFILSSQHSPDKPRKDRIRDALLRWHPDRFESKWLKKVVEEEREAVKEGVGLVVRALNDLLSTEGTFSG